LTTSDRTVLPRQQTLRALIDWSYDLLAPSEQALVQRLSVFAGGWTLSRRSGLQWRPIDADQVVDLLTNLVDKSLVELDAEGSRYRMLETVRQYAAERLDASADDAVTRSRHLAWCVALAQRARDGLVGSEAGRCLNELDAERENILAAHRWCDDATDSAVLGLG
jgi:predicted ATPase